MHQLRRGTLLFLIKVPQPQPASSLDNLTIVIKTTVTKRKHLESTVPIPNS